MVKTQMILAVNVGQSFNIKRVVKCALVVFGQNVVKGEAKMIKADICILGAGSGGLSVAAQLGVKVVLIEKNKMGFMENKKDCANFGLGF